MQVEQILLYKSNILQISITPLTWANWFSFPYGFLKESRDLQFFCFFRCY